MPIVEGSKYNWADDADEEAVETIEENGYKRVIEFKMEDDKKVKVTNVFKIEKIKMSKSVAERKKWAKFGEASNDPPGVNSGTTVVGEEVFMQFLGTKEEEKQEVSTAPVPMVKCRYCRGDHWSAKCPHKDLLLPMAEMKESAASGKAGTPTSAAPGGAGGAYRPPSVRSGADPRGPGGARFEPKGLAKDEFTVRVTNLPEEATENDLMELFKPFGKVNRVFLAKDKNTQASRGFAFINFQNKEDAQRAIYGVNDYGYAHLILKVEWAKPPKENN